MIKKLFLSALVFIPGLPLQAQQLFVCADDPYHWLCDADGKQVIRYDSIQEQFFPNEDFFVSRNGKWGLVDHVTGKEILPCEYISISPLESALAIYLLESEKGLVFYDLLSGKNISPYFQASLAHCRVDGRMCYAHPNDPLMVAMNGKQGAMTYEGRITIPFEYDELWSGRLNLTNFMYGSKDGKYYVFDSLARPLNRHNYDDIIGFWNENALMAKRGAKTVFIDTKGAEHGKHDSLGRYRDFYKGGKYALFDVDGNNITGYKYDMIGVDLYPGYFRVFNNNLTGVIDSAGKELIPCLYNDIGQFGTIKLCIASNLENKAGIIDLNGKVLLPLEYDNIWSWYGMAIIQKRDMYGYVDGNGKLIADCIYDEAKHFGTAGLAAVNQMGRWGFIDRTGKLVVPFKYNHADIFINGKAKIELDGKIGYLDEQGNEHW